MNPALLESVGLTRARTISASLARHRLVFCQIGMAFEPIRRHIIDSAVEIVVVPEELPDLLSPGRTRPLSIAICELERLAVRDEAPQMSLGTVRELVTELIDSGSNILLVSRAPRVSFQSTPGSSLLEDAALCNLSLLADHECPASALTRAGWQIPIVGFGDEEVDLSSVFSSMLAELGHGVLSSIDHAFFEFDPASADGLKFMSHRELEALTCAGLVRSTEDGPVLCVPRRLTPLKDALSELLSDLVRPVDGLEAVVTGLWTIERTIRRALRGAAVAQDGSSWRGSLAPGGLAIEILNRARSDAAVTAASVRELRDPTEWLTLGELMDLVQSKKFENLGIDRVLWRRFIEDLVPVRNRVSHMRLPKSTDEETVLAWVKIISRVLR